MNTGKHFHVALVILLYIHHAQSMKSIHERMLNSAKHAPTTTQQIIPQNTDNNEELLMMYEAQISAPSVSENIQTTSASSNGGYCSSQSLSYGSNSNNIDTSIDDYYQHWEAVNAFPHGTNSTTSTTPSPTSSQLDKPLKYDITLTNTSSSPVISWINKTSTYQQVFNPSWIQAIPDQVKLPGILAQVQNCSLTPGQCKVCNKTSGLVFTTCDLETNKCHPLGAPSGKVPYTSPIPGKKNPLNADEPFKNPSIFYWRQLFYMFVNDLDDTDQDITNKANETQQNYIKYLYTNKQPDNASSNWTKHEGAFDTKITAPAALLSMNNLTNLKYANDDGIHWLFYGGQGHISVTNSCTPLLWQNIDTMPWLEPRPDHFDKDGVETGPAPIKLFDGNYLMLYNGYSITGRPPTPSSNDPQMNGMIVPHQIKHYEIGWVILDGKNPKKILQRSDKPLITATNAYEQGDAPYTCAQSHSVYAKAIVPLDGSSNETHQTFRVYFSAADTSVGSAVISIGYASLNSKQETEWMTIAIVVSIICGVFVVVMFLVIWCKNNKETEIVDLTTDPEYISIASARFSKEISGTNHNGTSYVIGSLDRKERQLMNGIGDGSRIERQSVYSSHHSHRGHGHGHKHHKHKSSRRAKDGNHKRSRRQSVRKYETNEFNPNHVHIHTTDCYDEEDDSQNCRFLTVNTNVENMNLHSSLNSNISTNSSSTTSSSSTASTSCTSSSGSRSNTMDSPSSSSSSSSYCSHCHGKYHNHKNNNNHYKSPSKTQTRTMDMSQSETMRLSQISFRINETLEKESPTSTGGNLITIQGYNPTTTQFSFYDRTNLTLGERLIHNERQ